MTASVPFQIHALDPKLFIPLFGLPDAELAARGIRRHLVQEFPGTPCRVSLTDALVGEIVLLLPFTHQEANSPYRSSGPIFVRENVARAQPAVDEVPESVRGRLLSVRAYDAEGMMTNADVVDGAELEPCISRCFGDASVAYLHLHNARPGCYSCRVDRV